MNWLTEAWYKERDDGGWTLRFENPKAGSYIGRIQDINIAEHIVWIHNCIITAKQDCTSDEGTHMLRYGIPVHMDENKNFYPCMFMMFGMTKEALIDMMKS